MRDKLSGRYPIVCKKGPECVFDEKEEKILENWVLECARAGFPITKELFSTVVSKLAKDTNKKFKENDDEGSFTPGRSWFKLFMKRHPAISFRTAQNLTSSRADVTKEQLTSWFDKVHHYLDEENLSDVLNFPERIFNADESAFFLCPKIGKILAEKKSKTVYSHVNPSDKECLTVLVTGS